MCHGHHRSTQQLGMVQPPPWCTQAPEFMLILSCVLFCKFGDFGGAVGNDYRTAVSWIGVVHA